MTLTENELDLFNIKIHQTAPHKKNLGGKKKIRLISQSLNEEDSQMIN